MTVCTSVHTVPKANSDYCDGSEQVLISEKVLVIGWASVWASDSLLVAVCASVHNDPQANPDNYDGTEQEISDSLLVTVCASVQNDPNTNPHNYDGAEQDVSTLCTPAASISLGRTPGAPAIQAGDGEPASFCFREYIDRGVKSRSGKIVNDSLP